VSNLVNYIPVAVPGADAYPIDAGDFAIPFPWISDLDYGASRQWLFGHDGTASGAPSLVDKIAGKTATWVDLTQQSYNTSYVTTQTSTTRRGGLASDVLESDEETAAIVTRYSGTPADAIIAGTLSDNGAAGGWGFYAAGGVYKVNTRGGAIANVAIPEALSDGDWMIVFVGHSLADSVRRVYVGGASAPADETVNKVRSTRAIAAGNGYYAPASFPAGISIAALTLYPRLLSAGEMMFAAQRAKRILATRSITLIA